MRYLPTDTHCQYLRYLLEVCTRQEAWTFLTQIHWQIQEFFTHQMYFAKMMDLLLNFILWYFSCELCIEYIQHCSFRGCFDSCYFPLSHFSKHIKDLFTWGLLFLSTHTFWAVYTNTRIFFSRNIGNQFAFPRLSNKNIHKLFHTFGLFSLCIFISVLVTTQRRLMSDIEGLSKLPLPSNQPLYYY